MTDYEKSVMRNIIYAVETGGQVYGNKDYADFTEAYTNTDIEHAITIGAGQWYAVEAKNLLNKIREKNPTLFSSLDTAGISSDLNTADWSVYKVSKTSAKAKCIVKMIDSETGHQCQDQLVDEQMEIYISEAENLGVSDTDAKMMCANFRHQGGLKAVTRILAKTAAPYTLDYLYTASQTDTGNQVGAYKSRQKMVYESLKKYISNLVITADAAIQAAIKVAQNEVGYLEKASNADLDSKTGNAGSNNYTKYWRDIKPSSQGQFWCACFVTWVFVQAFGRPQAEQLLIEYPFTYCPDFALLFTKHADPKVGDIVLYHNGSRYNHTGLVIEVNGDKFITIEGNTSPDEGVNANGGGVYQKTQYNLSSTKFVRPDYSIITSINSGGSGETPYPSDSWVPTGTATCTGSKVNVRLSPGGTAIGSLSKGERFEVDGTKSGVWVHIKAAGVGIGYMHEDYVNYDGNSEDSWITAGTATCTGQGVYVRATPDGTIVGSLSKGNRVEVDGTKSGVWVHIKAAGVGIGYMHQDYVSYDDNEGSSIKTAQIELNNRFSAGLSIDGKWGPACKKAYITAIQSALNSVYGAGLSVDGIWGSKTESAISAHNLSQGANNLFVGVLQIGLCAHNVLTSGIDCSFGPATKQSVIAFQSKNGLSADGTAGLATFKALAQSDSSGGSDWISAGTAICTGNGVYVRATPDGTIIGQLYKGDTFEVDGTRSGVWMHVNVAGTGIGYMHQNYVGTNGASSTSTIQTAQKELNSRFSSGLSVDGKWGPACKKAYITAIQSALNSVYGAGLSADGIWGSETASAISSHNVIQGSNNLFVGVLQIGLYAHGIQLSNGIDCDFGSSTKQGVISFQNSNGLGADGVAGVNTYKALAEV